MPGGERRKWVVVAAAIWVQALTGTNFDFAAYSSALKVALGVSQVALNYLATASDLGKAFGWSSGLALLYLPLPAVLLLSAALGLAAYALQWMLLTARLALPYPLVFLACLVAGCSICWFNTVCFVLCIRNFYHHRSLALSLTLSFNGVSAALYTLFADALSPASSSSSSSSSVYLLLNAVVPLAVSVTVLPAIVGQPANGVPHNTPERDKHVFLALHVIAFVTGVYLLPVSSITSTSRTATWAILIGAMLLLALPLLVPVYLSHFQADTPVLEHDGLRKPLLSGHRSGESNATTAAPPNYVASVQGDCCGSLEKSRAVVLGEEHSARKLIRNVDFWLYYVAYFCGATVGLVYSNNLGQIAESLHLQSQLTMLLAVYSSCSFFGRLLSAVPDFLRGKVSFARTGWLAAALVPMPAAFFLLWKLHGEYALVAGTALVGLSSGFIFAAAVSVTSELFGPNSVGVNHNILITNIPLGSLLYGQIAALVYDANGQEVTVVDNRTGAADTMIVCMGTNCYAATFFLWGCITVVGLASSVALFLRTRSAYARCDESVPPSTGADLTQQSKALKIASKISLLH